jgi:DNA polymerase-1
MELELKINIQDNSADVRKKVQATKAKVSAADETIEEAFERIALLKFDEKEQELFNLAKAAFAAGEIGRLGEGKMNKGEVLSMGAKVRQRRESELKTQRISDLLANKPDNFYVLTKDSELAPFMQRIRDEVKLQAQEWAQRFEMLGVQSLTACDFEGTGIDAYLDLSIGFSIWLPLLKEGYYLAYGHVDINDLTIPREYAYKAGDAQLTRSKVLEKISKYLATSTHGKSFHMGSARYDLHIAENDGYTINGAIWDTLDAMQLMTENLDAYGLKPLIQRYGKRHLGIQNEVYTFDDLFGKRSPAPFSTELVGIYAIYDVYYGWKLTEWQFETMKKTDNLMKCYAEIDSKLPQVDVFINRMGFHIDLDAVRELESSFTKKLREAKAAIYTDYNIDEHFLRDMSISINGKKIEAWKEKLTKNIEKAQERLINAQIVKEQCERDSKTHLKKYEQAHDNITKYAEEAHKLRNQLTNEDSDLFIKSFEFTNNNHLGYLIYDKLGIADKTYKVNKGKKRSTAAAVLEMYYEDEEALAPLAKVATYEKLLGTYVQKILGTGEHEYSAMEVDGRFHSEFKAGGTATGRYSSAAYSGRPTSILDEFKGA